MNIFPLIAKSFGLQCNEEFYIRPSNIATPTDGRCYRFTEFALEVCDINRVWHWADPTNILNGIYVVCPHPAAEDCCESFSSL